MTRGKNHEMEKSWGGRPGLFDIMIVWSRCIVGMVIVDRKFGHGRPIRANNTRSEGQKLEEDLSNSEKRLIPSSHIPQTWIIIVHDETVLGLSRLGSTIMIIIIVVVIVINFIYTFPPLPWKKPFVILVTYTPIIYLYSTDFVSFGLVVLLLLKRTTQISQWLRFRCLWLGLRCLFLQDRKFLRSIHLTWTKLF